MRCGMLLYLFGSQYSSDIMRPGIYLWNFYNFAIYAIIIDSYGEAKVYKGRFYKGNRGEDSHSGWSYGYKYPEVQSFSR